MTVPSHGCTPLGRISWIVRPSMMMSTGPCDGTAASPSSANAPVNVFRIGIVRRPHRLRADVNTNGNICRLDRKVEVALRTIDDWLLLFVGARTTCGTRTMNKLD